MLDAMLFDFRYAPDNWHRTIECDDWADAREAATGAASTLKAEWVEVHSFDGLMETWRCVEGKWEQVSTAKGPRRAPQTVYLARGEIPPQDYGPWVLVDIRPMSQTDGVSGPREADGGFTYFADLQNPQDIKEAIHEATVLATKRGLPFVFVRGRNG